MVTITLTGEREGVQHSPLEFRIPARSALVAGSRNGGIDPEEAEHTAALASAGFSFLVGCATGVDAASVSRLLSARRGASPPSSPAPSLTAFARASRAGSFASVVVPQGLSPAAALRRRTLWMVKRAELVVLFPDDPLSGRWGRGSTLAFRAATEQLKPVFVVSNTAPRRSPVYQVVAARLFDMADGWWAVPHPVAAGTCDEEV